MARLAILLYIYICVYAIYSILDLCLYMLHNIYYIIVCIYINTCIELFVHRPSLVQPKNHPISPSPHLQLWGRIAFRCCHLKMQDFFQLPKWLVNVPPPGHVTLFPETAGLICLVVEPTPPKKMLVEMGSSSSNRGENQKYLKPPPGYYIRALIRPLFLRGVR